MRRISSESDRGEAVEPARGRRWVAAVAVGALLLTAAGIAASLVVKSPAQAAADSEAPPSDVLTAPVERRVLKDSVIIRGTVTTGTYLLDGIDTGALKDAERTALRGRRIGFVFQSFHLLPHRSALENVLLAMVYNGVPRKERAARAREALDRVGLGHRIAAPPTRLSGGERQRVAIARALVARPSLLLCDEPTGNLDTANANTVLGLLDGLHADGMTVLVITHDADVAARGARAVAIRDGVLTEQVVATWS